MKSVDIHAHLDSGELEYFLTSHDQDSLTVVSNSVDVASSVKNLELAKKFRSVVPFVGIHPELFRETQNRISKEEIDKLVNDIRRLVSLGKGIGEIGIDPGYGHMDGQKHLLKKMLEIAEKTNLPITLHSRGATSSVLDIISTHDLKSRILFHWFAGTVEELKRIHSAGMYTSFGPSIIFSKRMQSLVQLSDSRYLLAETDSPTKYKSLLNAPGSPVLVCSVIYQIGLLLNLSFDRTRELLYINSNSYLSS